MSDYPRLSELAGISELDEADAVGSWPLNTALVLIGAAIVAIAFYFLDPQDTRWLHNPWTYAIATPVSTLLLSILLSTFVSRIVEKSMQLAFLLSVLVHLILLVYAVNIIVFSRMWPEVLESFDRQRHQLERETLQANQYHRVSASSQSGQRPDYLRFVPTQHQPTEIEDSETPALRLAESETNNLVSPSPKIELLVNPHLLERDRVVPAMPTASEHAASLSRSNLQHKLDASSPPEQPPTLPSEAEPSPIAPSATTDVRRQQRDNASAALAPEKVSPVTPKDPPKLPELSRARTRDVAGSRTSPPPSLALPRESLAAMAPNAQPRIASPKLESTVEPPPLSRIASNESEQRRSPSAELSISPLAAQPAPMANHRQSLNRNQRNDLARTELQWSAPDKSLGIASQPIERELAGGSAGLTAPRSTPVHGVDSLAGNVTPTPTELVAPRESLTRPQRNNRVASSMLELGAAQSQSWNGSLSLSAGVAGRSPAQLAEENADGNAAATDVANLTGSAGAIQRSALGSDGQAGASSPHMPGSRVAELQGTDFGDTLSMSAGLESARVDIGRSNSSTSSTSHGTPAPDLPLQKDQRLGSSLPLGVAPRPFPSVDTLAEAASAAVSSPDRASALSDSAPAAGQVALPAVDTNLQSFDSSATASSQLAPAVGITRGSRSDSPMELPGSMPLEIEAAVGQGGIAPVLNNVGLLLPRRNSINVDANPTELETQRFARQDVGGPLAAGQKVALPTPAFQQRLERLQDRNPQDETTAEPQTELAIERGLAFLAKHQRPDGSWRLQDFDTQVLMRSDTAATALSLLAFQGAGYTHKQFKYADVVDKAIQFLRQHQQTNGDLYIEQDPASNQNAWLYSHGIAALALCEAYGMTQDPELKAAAQKSIDFMVASQDPQRGGWRYRPGVGTDTSVTGWFMMAFKSGQLAGLDVPAKSFDAIRTYLEASKSSDSEPHLYRYNPFAPDTIQQQHGLKPTAVMTSVGLLMRLYTGWQRDRKEMQDGADFLLERLPTLGSRTNSLRDTYYWYYATQVVFHMGGERWDRWHDVLYPLLIEHQVAQGEYAGSWDPMVPTPDLWARYGGRLYVTTLNLLSLEVSYRHLPLYEATAGDRL